VHKSLIHLRSGHSWPNKIVIESERHVTEALHLKDDDISGCVIKTRAWTRHEYREPPLPFIRQLIFNRIYFSTVILAIAIFLLFLNDLLNARELSHALTRLEIFIPLLAVIILMHQIAIIFYSAMFVSKWHGAEHKIMIAYTERGFRGAFNASYLETTSHVQEECGTIQWVALLVCLTPFTFLPLKNALAFGLLLHVFIVLQNRGIVHIYPHPFMFLSKWIQRFFVTASPNICHLNTAQAALRKLLQASHLSADRPH